MVAPLRRESVAFLLVRTVEQNTDGLVAHGFGREDAGAKEGEEAFQGRLSAVFPMFLVVGPRSLGLIFGHDSDVE